jgi:IclR family acetate operon transcriptional repressor
MDAMDATGGRLRITGSVDRVAVALEVLAASGDGLGVSEVATALGIHKATASRLLGTLGRRGLVERTPGTLRYRLGPRLVSLAGGAVGRLPIVSQARAELEALTDRTSETSNLAILDRFHVVYVDQVTPRQAVVMASWVGRRSPAHASSSGKVLLAFGEAAEREAALARPLEPLTKATITGRARLRRVLEETRRRGFALSVGELEDGLVTIAAPVIADGRAVAAVSCSGPTYRIGERDHARLARHVVDAAAAVGHRVAGRSDAPRDPRA